MDQLGQEQNALLLAVSMIHKIANVNTNCVSSAPSVAFFVVLLDDSGSKKD
jgi:hypothetical protein